MKRKAAHMQTEIETRPHLDLRVVQVDNPLFSKSHVEDKHGNIRKISAVMNVRESGIATLAAQKKLDMYQVAAADKVRKLWETMGGAGAGAIDYSREHVDGGPSRDPITQRQVSAGKELARIRPLVGKHGFELVIMIAGNGQSLHDLYQTRRERDTAADMLRVYLTQLAVMWGFAERVG